MRILTTEITLPPPPLWIVRWVKAHHPAAFSPETHKLSECRPDTGQRCLITTGKHWRDFTFYRDEDLRMAGSKLVEGFYTDYDDRVNLYKKDPVWMQAPPYPKGEQR